MNMSAPAIRMYKTTWCSDCHVAKRVLEGHNIPYDAVDIEDDPAARDEVMRINGGYSSVPTIIMPSGSVLVEPSRMELERALKDEGLLLS
jgi:mycoredoxin